MSSGGGLIMYRVVNDTIEVLVAHSGGPANKNNPRMGFPKGGANNKDGVIEPPFETAKREFWEETGITPPEDESQYIFVGTSRRKAGSGGRNHFWAFPRDWRGEVKSIYCEVEWPPRSGQKISIPEVDYVAYVGIDVLDGVLYKSQIVLVDALKAIEPELKELWNKGQTQMECEIKSIDTCG